MGLNAAISFSFKAHLLLLIYAAYKLMLTEHRTTQHRHGRLAIIDGKKCIFITKKYPIVKVNNRALTKLNSSYYNNLYRITNTSRFAKDIYIMIYR